MENRLIDWNDVSSVYNACTESILWGLYSDEDKISTMIDNFALLSAGTDTNS